MTPSFLRFAVLVLVAITGFCFMGIFVSGEFYDHPVMFIFLLGPIFALLAIYRVFGLMNQRGLVGSNAGAKVVFSGRLALVATLLNLIAVADVYYFSEFVPPTDGSLGLAFLILGFLAASFIGWVSVAMLWMLIHKRLVIENTDLDVRGFLYFINIIDVIEILVAVYLACILPLA